MWSRSKRKLSPWNNYSIKRVNQKLVNNGLLSWKKKAELKLNLFRTYWTWNWFKELLNEFRNNKAKLNAQEQGKGNNLLKKQHIIEQMKQLVESNDDVSAICSCISSIAARLEKLVLYLLQQPTNFGNNTTCIRSLSGIWSKINNELQGIRFQKNLEAKQNCAKLPKCLANEEDVVSAFRQLQNCMKTGTNLSGSARTSRRNLEPF